jgi:hypothetical protein
MAKERSGGKMSKNCHLPYPCSTGPVDLLSSFDKHYGDIVFHRIPEHALPAYYKFTCFVGSDPVPAFRTGENPEQFVTYWHEKTSAVKYNKTLILTQAINSGVL